MILITQIAIGIFLGGLFLLLLFSKVLWDSLWSLVAIVFFIGLVGYGFYANAIKMALFLCSILLPALILLGIAGLYDRSSNDGRLRIEIDKMSNSWSNLPRPVRKISQSVAILLIIPAYLLFLELLGL